VAGDGIWQPNRKSGDDGRCGPGAQQSTQPAALRAGSHHSPADFLDGVDHGVIGQFKFFACFGRGTKQRRADAGIDPDDGRQRPVAHGASVIVGDHKRRHPEGSDNVDALRVRGGTPYPWALKTGVLI
jgi:hypothetical protein